MFEPIGKPRVFAGGREIEVRGLSVDGIIVDEASTLSFDDLKQLIEREPGERANCPAIVDERYTRVRGGLKYRTPLDRKLVAYKWQNRRNANLTPQQRVAIDHLIATKAPAYVMQSELRVRVFRADAEHYHHRDVRGRLGLMSALVLRGFKRHGAVWYSPACTVEDYGVVSRRVITNNGVGFLVDSFQNLVEMEAMNFHGVGTSGTAEAAADAALGTEVESRATGTQSEPASNQYRTVGTITATAPRALVEHGIFSASTSGVLWDRSVYTVVNLATNDSIQTTYTVTFTAGGT